MAFPAWAGAAMQAGSGILGNVMGYLANDKMNHDNRNFAGTMYNTEKNDAYAQWLRQNQRDDETWNRQNMYNKSMWDEQNRYNSPAAQMARFKEAGLNPNLIYGQQSQAGSVATANLDSSKMQMPSGRSVNQTAFQPNFQFLNDGLMSILAIREKAVQIDNAKEDTEIKKNTAANIAAQTAASLAGIGLTRANTDYTRANLRRNEFDLSLASDLRSTSMDAAKAALRRTQIESDIALRQDARSQQMQPLNMEDIRQRIKSAGIDQTNKTFDSELKRIEIYLKSMPKGTELINRFGGTLLKELSEMNLKPSWWDNVQKKQNKRYGY